MVVYGRNEFSEKKIILAKLPESKRRALVFQQWKRKLQKKQHWNIQKFNRNFVGYVTASWRSSYLQNGLCKDGASYNNVIIFVLKRQLFHYAKIGLGHFSIQFPVFRCKNQRINLDRELFGGRRKAIATWLKYGLRQQEKCMEFAI